jgi:hypothetical protein
MALFLLLSEARMAEILEERSEIISELRASFGKTSLAELLMKSWNTYSRDMILEHLYAAMIDI